MQRTCALFLLATGILSAAGCITTTPKLALRWPGDLKREQVERSLSFARLNERQGKHNEALATVQESPGKRPEERDGAPSRGCHRGEGRPVWRKVSSRSSWPRPWGSPRPSCSTTWAICCICSRICRTRKRSLRAAVQTDSRYKNARNNLGLVLAEQGRFDEALVEFKQVGSEAEAYSNLAFVQTKLGRVGGRRAELS